MKIYTKTGDKGKTSLVSGTNVSKGDERIDLYGEIDELNSSLGVVLSQIRHIKELNNQSDLLLKVQHTLFDLGSNLACEFEKRSKYKLPSIKEDLIKKLENSIDKMQTELMPLKNFILPGGSPEASFVHMARTICRRAERRLIRYYDQDSDEKIPQSIELLNRLSDYLFVLSRYVNFKNGVTETIWEKQ